MKKSAGIVHPKNHSNYMRSFLISMNDGVRICSEACACCWDKPLPTTYAELCDYIGRRTSIGHNSILEHSSFITVTRVPFFCLSDQTILDGLIDALTACRYLNVRASTDDSNYWFLIGGSYRGYNELIRRLTVSLGGDVVSNAFIRSLCGPIYQYLTPECMLDLINNGYLDYDLFKGVEPDPVCETFVPITHKYSSDKVDVVSVDDVMQIRKNLFNVIGADIFTNDDIMRLSSLTIMFKDMSRTATHQLVRHRNGITQESQRYVDYSDAAFADPCSFKPEKYDPSKIYTIHFGGQEFNFTSMQLGEEIIGIYRDMLDHGMAKEDARAFLPSNVKCRKLYMTFTYQNFLKFLDLRTAKGAQAEIRSFATELQKNVGEYVDLSSMTNDPIKGVDQVIGTKEEIFDKILKVDEAFQNSEIAEKIKEENQDD